MRRLLLLRPEPGLTASAERARAMGLDVLSCPLFRIEPVGWQVPDPAAFDALLLTSANAVRHGGAGLQALRTLPVHGVGAATAESARAAGFRVETVGADDIRNLLDEIPTSLRLLHLAGEDHQAVNDPRIRQRLIVYRSAQVADPPLPPLEGLVAAVHSPRAGRRLAALVADRAATAVAAISRAAAEACGSGWERIDTADAPNDNSLLALAARLCHISSPQ